MPEYIERKAALGAVRALLGPYNPTFLAGLYTAETALESVPAADVASVVHGR